VSLESKIDLLLRGQHILMRANFSPTNPEAQAKHFVNLQNDIGPWFNDYVAAFAEPVADVPKAPLAIDRD
jgi:hypothetical protein